MNKWKESEYFKLDMITAAICLIALFIGACFYNQMPTQLPIHYDSSNQPDNYASKGIVLFLMPVLVMIIHLVVCRVMESDLRQKNTPAVMQYVSRFILPITAIMVEVISIMYVTYDGINVSRITGTFLGILFLLIGNYLPKCKYNHTVGYRIPWTLASESNWNKTHRFAGILMVISSIGIIICAILDLIPVVVTLLIVDVLVPSIYSYALSRKELASNK